MNSNLRKIINQKRLIFTITTGRSGMGYLAQALSSVPGVTSYHEPEPKFSDIMYFEIDEFDFIAKQGRSLCSHQITLK